MAEESYQEASERIARETRALESEGARAFARKRLEASLNDLERQEARFGAKVSEREAFLSERRIKAPAKRTVEHKHLCHFIMTKKKLLSELEKVPEERDPIANLDLQVHFILYSEGFR